MIRTRPASKPSRSTLEAAENRGGLPDCFSSNRQFACFSQKALSSPSFIEADRCSPFRALPVVDVRPDVEVDSAFVLVDGGDLGLN